MSDNNRIPTMPQNETIERSATVPQNGTIERSATVPQNENIERNSTVPQNIDAERESTVPQNDFNNIRNEEIDLDGEKTYISDNGRLTLKIKDTDEIKVKSGESRLFKNKVYNNEGKEVEVLIKILKNIDIESDAKKLENRKKILELVYKKGKEVEKNNLARVISYGKVITEKNHEYFAEVYRYYSGGDLFNKAPLKYEELEKNVIPSLLKALRYLHSHNIVHRDIKPENIYIDDKGKIYLGDFGIARYIESNIDYDEKKFGTLGYAAPELLLPNTGRVKKESDYYSLGQTLYTLFTKKLMYESVKDKKLLNDDMMSDKYYGLSRLNEHKLFEALIRGLLKYSPADRFNDKHIERFLKGDNTLKREVKMEEEGNFDFPLRIYGKTLWSKNEMYDFLIQNKDKADEILNNEFLSQNFEKNNMLYDAKKMSDIERLYLTGDNFEKKYQLFELYKFLKDEYIFVWGNEEIKDYKQIPFIPHQELKRLLQRGTIQEFLTKSEFDTKFIERLEEIKNYKSILIAFILIICFDPDNNGKNVKEYTYRRKDFNDLIKEWINNKNEALTPLLALLYINGYDVDINENDFNSLKFLMALEKEAKEDEVKLKIREKFLERNINNVNYKYNKLKTVINDINSSKYEATGLESQEILDNICNCQIFLEKMDINKIMRTINNFENKYQEFERKFENNPYSVIMKSYPEDVIITRHYSKYPQNIELRKYNENFKKEVSEKKLSLKNLTKYLGNVRIAPFYLASIISFILGYVFSINNLYANIENVGIRDILPTFQYLFYGIGVYFIIKAVTFTILQMSTDYKVIEREYDVLFERTFGNDYEKNIDRISDLIHRQAQGKFEEDYSEAEKKLYELAKKYGQSVDNYKKIRKIIEKIQHVLPVLSMTSILFFTFKNLDIFANEYFFFKMYCYLLFLATIYIFAIETHIDTYFSYSVKIWSTLSIISIIGVYTYNRSIEYTLNSLIPCGIAVVLFAMLWKNIEKIIESIDTSTIKGVLFYIMLIPGILVPLSLLTTSQQIGWFYFSLLLAVPAAIGMFLNSGNLFSGYVLYKIPFALLGYSLIGMTQTSMFSLTGIFNGFIVLLLGDVLVVIVLMILFGVIASIF